MNALQDISLLHVIRMHLQSSDMGSILSALGLDLAPTAGSKVWHDLKW